MSKSPYSDLLVNENLRLLKIIEQKDRLIKEQDKVLKERDASYYSNDDDYDKIENILDRIDELEKANKLQDVELSANRINIMANRDLYKALSENVDKIVLELNQRIDELEQVRIVQNKAMFEIRKEIFNLSIHFKQRIDELEERIPHNEKMGETESQVKIVTIEELFDAIVKQHTKEAVAKTTDKGNN